MELEFVKMEGIGNDFIIINDLHGEVETAKPYPALARQLCSRHFGIGADGILLILPSKTHDFKFQIFNSDGSSAQMCGNGIRCVAKYVYENKIVDKKNMQVETLAGTIRPQVIVNTDGTVESVQVDMGKPILSCKEIPFISDLPQAIEAPLDVDDQTYTVTTVSMGNPHAVVFVDTVEDVDVKKVGQAIETHERFPEKTNVEFIEVVNKNELKMKVWERGAGITLACGTGACAAFIAANLTSRVGETSVVHLDGGDLTISLDKSNGHVLMQGPASLVFKGCVQI